MSRIESSFVYKSGSCQLKSIETSGAATYEEWIGKRKRTTIAFTIQMMLIGCDYGIFIINLWLYLTEMIKPQHPEFFYSLISIGFLLSATGSSIFICKLADKTRSVRKIMFFSNLAFVLGNLIYVIPFSPWILLVGRIIAGFGQPGRSVIVGELARCYPDDQIASVFSIMGAAMSFGFMIAPGLNIIFSAADVWIGPLHITYANVSGLYIAVFFVCSQFVLLVMVSDLSKNYDLKEDKTMQSSPRDSSSNANPSTEFSNETTDDIPNREVAYENVPLISPGNLSTIQLARRMFTNYDTLLLLGLQFLETFFVFSMDMCLPVLIVTNLQWSLTAYNIIMLGTGKPILIISMK